MKIKQSMTVFIDTEKQKQFSTSDNDDIFESIYTTVASTIQKNLGKGAGWIINSVIEHKINISKYNPLAGSTYIKLPKALDHPRKRLINIQNIDDSEYFK